MRLRLGLLRNSAAIDRQSTRETAEAQAKKHKHQIPTVKTEAKTKADEAAAARQKAKALEPPKPPPMPRIRPLSEAKAIDSGATFISEAFLFMVTGGLIVFEAWRSRKKETSRREDVAERLKELGESEKAARRGMVALEQELLRVRANLEKTSPEDTKRVLPRELWDVEDDKETVCEPQTWLSRVWRYFQVVKDRNANDKENLQVNNAANSSPASPPAPRGS
jgi:myosin-1